MRETRLRSTVKSVVAILCAACFLTVSVGTVSRAVAADTFETWPKKTTEPGVEAKQGTDNGAVMAGVRRERTSRTASPPERSARSPSGPPRSSGSQSPRRRRRVHFESLTHEGGVLPPTLFLPIHA